MKGTVLETLDRVNKKETWFEHKEDRQVFMKFWLSKNVLWIFFQRIKEKKHVTLE